jgi:DNA invertase Pin-like site-specific DNA recombinase
MGRIGYGRVSTRDQKPDSQHDALTAAGCEQIFIDKASGKLARRPEWDECLKFLRAGDELVITKLDRAGRSVRHLLDVAAELQTREVDLVVLQQGIDTTTPAGRLQFHVFAAMAEFVGDLISEGTHEGLAAARARGRIGGRPAKLTDHQVAAARKMLDAGDMTVTDIAAALKVSRATIYRQLDPARTSPAPAAAGRS